MLSVAERDEGRRDAALCSKLLRRSRKNQKWFASRSFLDVDVAPTHRFANAGAERFRHSLFCRETRSQMASRKFHRHRIFDLAVRENPMQKTISEPIN